MAVAQDAERARVAADDPGRDRGAVPQAQLAHLERPGLQTFERLVL